MAKEIRKRIKNNPSEYLRVEKLVTRVVGKSKIPVTFVQTYYVKANRVDKRKK